MDISVNRAIRWRAADFEAVRKRAAEMGLSPSAFIRMATLAALRGQVTVVEAAGE